MGHKPVGDTTTRSTSTSSAATGALAHKTGSLRVACVSADSFVAIGTNPTATAANGYYVHSGSAGIIALGAPGSNQVTGVSTTTATAGQQGADSGYITIIDFPEGTGSPFEVGDAVTLTVTNAGGGDQSYYDFSHKCVAYVDTSMGPNGYYGTRIHVNNDYGVGYAHTALSSSNYAELRGSFKVACITSTGSGNAYIQQVQVAGDT